MEIDIERILVKPNSSIKDTIKVIDKAAKQIALVVDKNKKLIGTVTDGDVRRGIIDGIKMKESVCKIMNKDFYSLHYNTPKEKLLTIFKQS